MYPSEGKLIFGAQVPSVCGRKGIFGCQYISIDADMMASKANLRNWGG